MEVINLGPLQTRILNSRSAGECIHEDGGRDSVQVCFSGCSVKAKMDSARIPVRNQA